ncbi:MAG: UDP-glucose 4-epimerase GalE [Pseudomonadales bacterium]
MKVLLTGGAGYIGTHTAVELINAGHEIVVIDNLSNSSVEAIRRVERLTNGSIEFHEIDLLSSADIDAVFRQAQIEAVIHFAGLKAVGESVSDPLRYYKTNIGGTFNLIEAMLNHEVTKLVFSSSATVYGEPERIPIDETCKIVDATNPYGRTKLIIEKLLADVCRSHADLDVTCLRYFNPAGAHESGEIGEDPLNTPNNLLPFLTQVAIGRREKLIVNGTDYPTPDGTCIRDYIHVVDLAKGHLAALEYLDRNRGWSVYNLGTGKGYSVLEVIAAFERANSLSLPHEMGPRRPGDIPLSYTKTDLARAELGWQTEKTIDDICRDAWHFQQRNPAGYRT